MNEKYTTEECPQEFYNSLEEQLKEKDAMIDWLAERLESFYPNLTSKESWKQLAQEAVKKND